MDRRAFVVGHALSFVLNERAYSLTADAVDTGISSLDFEIPRRLYSEICEGFHIPRLQFLHVALSARLY